MLDSLYRGDAYALMPEILAAHAGKRIAIVTDPPYEFDASGGGMFRKMRKAMDQIHDLGMNKGFDPDILFHDEVSSIVCFMHNDQIAKILPKIAEIFDRYALCGLIKKNPMPMANKSYLSDAEFYVHAWDKGAHPIGDTVEKRRFTMVGREKKVWNHPTVKPLVGMEKIVSNVNADLIIDPFMGTGTTGVACIAAGKQFVGIERNEEFFMMAVERLSRTQPIKN